MKKTLSALGLLTAAEGRKHLVKPSGKRIRQPRVRGDCEPACIFEDEGQRNYWCLDFDDPHCKLGWEWVQELNETDDSPAREYFSFDIQAYVETYFYMKSEFNTPRLYYNEVILELEEFKAYIWFRNTVNQHWQFCSGVGWGNEQIDLNVEMKQKLAQCYKVLINDTCTFEDVWYGRNAKIFEGCELSQDGSDEVDLEFYTWEIQEKQEDMTWLGTSQPYSDQYCYPLPLIGRTTAGASLENANMSAWAKQAYLAVGNWFNMRYGKQSAREKTFNPTIKEKLPHFQLPW